MALGDGTGWDTAAPADTDLRSVGAKEIRDLRLGVGIRVDKEHIALSSSSAGGEHKEGSAVVYSEPAVTEPSNKPDGVTALDSVDEGRLLVSAGKMYLYSGTGWDTNHIGTFVVSSSFIPYIDVGYAFRIIVVSHSAGNNGVIMFNGISDQSARFMNLAGAGTNNDDRLEFQTVQDSGNPTDTYKFRVRSVNMTGTFQYAIIR